MATPRGTMPLLAQVALLVVPLAVAAGVLAFGIGIGADTQPTTSLVPTTPVPNPQRVDGGGTWAPTRVNADGSAVAWPDCTPIRWVHSTEHLPVGALRDVEEALRRLSAATGHVFVHVGATTEHPSADRDSQQDRYGQGPAPVLVAFVEDPGDLPLGPDDRAVTIAVAQGSQGDRRLITGQVVVRTDAGVVGDFDSRARGLGAVLLHEFGHLVGLNHVGDPDELMFAHPTIGPVEWGAGDLAGLAAVGSDGC